MTSPLAERLPRWSTAAPTFALVAVAGGGVVGVLLVEVARFPKLGLGAIAAVAAALVAMRWLTIGLLLLVALTYTNAFVVVKEQAGVPSAALPLALFLVVLAFLAPDRRTRFLPRAAEPAVIAFAVYGAWLIASSVWAGDPDVTLSTAGAYWKLMLMVLAVLALVRTPRVLSLAIWAVVVPAGVLAALSVVQHFHHDLTFYGFAQAPVQELETTGTATRVVGPVGNPNGYAQLLVVALPLAFGRILAERRNALRILAAVSLTLCLGAVYLTFSRGGFVGAAVVLVLCVLRYRARLAVLLVGAALILVVAGAVSGSYGARLATLKQAMPWYSNENISDPSIRGRAAFLRAGFHLWRDHPFGGIGYANYPVAYLQYNRRAGNDPTLGDSAHDTPVQVLAETGLVGLLLWLALFVTAFTGLWRARKRAADDRGRLTADFLGFCLVAYLVTALFVGGASQILAWLMLALALAAPAALMPPARSA